MSETTKKLRAFKTYSVGSCGVRDLAADAIEAVEAQVAEVVARVDAAERWAGVKFQAPASTVASASPAAPSAVPAPRGFREGDICRVIESKRTKENFLVGCEGRINPYRGSGGDWVIDCGTAKGVRCFYNSELTLVRAADAPESPAEEDTGLVVQRIRDEATKPLHVEIEKLRGEVARLTKDLAEARAIYAAMAERVRNETRIATELRKDLDDAKREASVWKRECEMFSKAWSRELGPRRPKSHLIDELVVGTKDLVAERDALRAELDEAKKWRDEFKRIEQAAEAELNALKAKPRFRTRKVRAKDAEAFDKEYYKREYAAGYEDYARAMNAVGLRRRVEQSK